MVDTYSHKRAVKTSIHFGGQLNLSFIQNDYAVQIDTLIEVGTLTHYVKNINTCFPFVGL